MSLDPPPHSYTVVFKIPSGDKSLPPYQTLIPVYFKFETFFLIHTVQLMH